jgi:CHAT domain-containing protein
MSCARRLDPQAAWSHARQAFEHGDLARAQREAESGYLHFRRSDAVWAWKFEILDAEALLWQGHSKEALTLLASEPKAALDRDLLIQSLSLQGGADARLHNFADADLALAQAEQLCVQQSSPACGGVMRSRGVLGMQRGQMLEVHTCFMRSLSFARAHGDRFMEANALLNLGQASLEESHFDEAIDWFNAAEGVALEIDAGEVAQTALGNLGWAYRGLGDSDKALDLTRQAESRAAELNDQIRRASWITNSGYVYMDEGQFPLAARALREALDLARSDQNKAGIFNALRALAFESERAGQHDMAGTYAKEAVAMARSDGNRTNELYPLLVTAQVARHQRNATTAEALFREVEQDTAATASLRWQAEYGLALLDEDLARVDDADREYKQALTTVEGARAEVRKEELRLPFLTNAFSIYDSYIQLLVRRGATDEALLWADYGRAQTLAEGYGLQAKKRTPGPEPLDVRRIARSTGATILFYWLGQKQSYLWVVTPDTVRLFPLPSESEIDEAVDDYNRALAGPQDLIEAGNDAGPALYRMLVAPAQELLAKSGKVYVIPNGALNNLNFETLVVPAPKPHYWIEDMTLVNANSLRLLARLRPVKMETSDRLLLFGDTISPNKDYPELPNAAVEMANIASKFSPTKQRVFAREFATPRAYLASTPEGFSFIHFAAHGTASRLSPLDSAIVLSRDSAAGDSFKLYARDIMQHPIRAELVTISTCYGAGTRTYGSEGMVGLSWAFLRAGAHNVVGALWEVSDVATAELMNDFYSDLNRGDSPDTALRTAKLKLLHSNGAFRRPFYWAPFQLYAGS